jgi:hypothetical protein
MSAWTSQLLTNGYHTVRFTNGGGGWIDLDAVQVFGPVNAGIYDDADPAWSYDGNWTTYNGAGPYSDTLYQSNSTGSYAEVTFKGTQVAMAYLKAPGRGFIDVTIDGGGPHRIDANSSTVEWMSVWTSPPLSYGVHTVRFTNGGGGWIDLDAVQIQ